MANPYSQLPDTDTLKHWLALYHAPGVGAVTFQRILGALPDLQCLGQTGSRKLEELGMSTATIAALEQTDSAAIARDLEWQTQPGNRIMTCRDPDYPVMLAQLDAPPPILYVHGNCALLSEPQLAMVGSRHPTPAGIRIATEFAQYLSAAGLVINSGLALGIDAACHTGALQSRAPTIAVMGTGLDRVYPARHRDLARQIAEQGALVSEFPVGTAPRAENFPQRNRLISGMSLGTLVVEAALRSGSLITARYAGEQGREVFAIPGSINNPLARGCHHLIRQGAKLVETAQDVIDELGMLAASCATAQINAGNSPGNEDSAKLAPDYQQLIDLMGFDNTSIDQLVSSSGLTPAEVSSMLLQLEMSGYLASSPGGLYNRLK
jgi:DNA processing protein